MKTFTAIIPLNELQKLYPEYQFNSQSEQEFVFLRLKEKYRGGGESLDISIINKELHFSWHTSALNPGVEKLNKEALLCARRKEYEKALHFWSQAIELNPHDPDILYNMGLVYFEIQDFNRGIDKCMESIKICPIYFRAHFVLGSVFSKMRRFQDAEKYLLEGLVLQSNNIMAMINLGAVYSILKNYKEAIRIFERAISLSPKETRGYLGLGKVYMAQGDMDNAARCFKAVIKLDVDGKLTAIARKSLRMITPEAMTDIPAPVNAAIIDENVEEIFAEGFQAFIKGDYQTSVTAYQKYLTQRNTEADVWASLASCQLRLGHGDAAIEAIKNAIKFGPGKAALYKQAAIIYDACDRFQESGQHALKAIEMGKNDSITLSLVGKSHFMNGNLQEAQKYLQEGLKLNPNNLQARYYFAQIMKKLGQKESARENLEEILWAKVETPLKEKARREMQILMN